MAIGSLTIVYACGHSTRTSLPGEHTVTRSTDSCMDCYRNSHRLLQEQETLAQFVDRKLREEKKSA